MSKAFLGGGSFARRKTTYLTVIAGFRPKRRFAIRQYAFISARKIDQGRAAAFNRSA
jgi:hypothetical protein